MPRALIVDGEASNREALCRLVEAEGFTVAAARGALDARLQLARVQPDIVFVDLDLPHGAGTALLDELAAGPAELIAMTGASVDAAVHAMRQGAGDCLVKPVDAPRLKAVLAPVPRGDHGPEIGALRARLRQLGRLGSTLARSPAIRAAPAGVRELKSQVERALITAGEMLAAVPAPTPDISSVTVPVGTSLADADRRLIIATLENCGGVKKRAADVLGISLKTLYNRLEEYRAGGTHEPDAAPSAGSSFPAVSGARH